MSFGSLRGDVVFEPLLLLPLVLSVLVLFVEFALSTNRRRVLMYIVSSSVVLLLCGVSSFATRPRAFDQALAQYGGSAMTVALVMLSVFYFYLWCRRIPGARHAMPLCVWAIGLFGKTPEIVQGSFIDVSWCAVAACLLYFVLCQWELNTEWIWFAFTWMTAATIGQFGMQGNQFVSTWFGAVVWLVLMFMFLGAIFDSWLANELRRIAGLAMIMASVACLAWVFLQRPIIHVVIALVVLPILCGIYMLIVKRMSWIYVTGMSAICMAISVGHFLTIQFGFDAFSPNHWPLKAGFVFFCVGVVITSAKTGIYQRKWSEIQNAFGEEQYESSWRLRPGF